MSTWSGRGGRCTLSVAQREVGNQIARIDLKDAKIPALGEAILPYIAETPFANNRADGLMYWYDNDFYRSANALLYLGVLAHFQPRSIIEIGAGFLVFAICSYVHIELGRT